MSKPDTRPCFSNVVLPPDFTRLKVPHDFNEHLSNVNANRATLKTTFGTWEVRPRKDEKNVYFVEGWPEFIERHSIGPADFLLFKYNGEMSFDVMIFDKNGSLKNHHQEESVSSFPSFEKKIKRYSIGSKSFLLIPKKFAAAHLPRSKQRITLQNSEGVSYLATILVNSKKCHSIVGGWKDFADGNSITEGDICTFELISKDVMEVHILRKQ